MSKFQDINNAMNLNLNLSTSCLPDVIPYIITIAIKNNPLVVEDLLELITIPSSAYETDKGLDLVLNELNKNKNEILTYTNKVANAEKEIVTSRSLAA